MTNAAERLSASDFLLLTTFRRDGSPVPTAVYVVSLDDGLGVWTVDGSAKVRRIHRDPRVTLAECDRLGTPHGPQAVEGKAQVLGASGTDRVRAGLLCKYDLTEEQLVAILQRMGPGRRDIGLFITVA